MSFLLSRKKIILIFLIATYCIYDLTISLYTAWDFTTDDAYISWYYARQLVKGNGLLWHVSLPPVEGYSNFLWVMIAALVIKLQLPLVTTMKIISSCSLGFALLFLYRLARLFLSPLLSIMPIFLFSHYAGVVWWTMSGLETLFYCALSLALVWQCTLAFGYHTTNEKQLTHQSFLYSTKHWITTNILLLLLSLARFEGVVWGVPLIFFIGCQYCKAKQYIDLKDFKKLYLWVLISFICCILPYLVYFIWRLFYFGHWIPNSYRCKALTYGQFLVVDLNYLLVILPLLVLSMPYFLLSTKKDCRHVLLWLPSAVYGVLLWKANPVITEGLRLFLGPFALFSILPVLGTHQFIKYLDHLNWDPEYMVVGIMLLMTVVFIPGNNLSNLSKEVMEYKERTQNRRYIADLLNQQAKKGASVLLDDCGVIPFFSREDLRFIDAQCLNNTDLTQTPFNRNLSLYAEYLNLKVKPDWVITNYYPIKSHGDYLTDRLWGIGFFNNYQLVAVLKSGYLNKSDLKEKKIIDFVYQIFKRST
ncbi:protein LphB [Legionella norrlandica]|uniref:Protein LphB n=1 Tax=Legionella norrlandica TaxID=1498499 RepID=A0A0A2T776_9GAMM|nr:protein LphB [Legionella norrlandica]KGP63283.1 protein LphB [Legionella norrlandica]